MHNSQSLPHKNKMSKTDTVLFVFAFVSVALLSGWGTFLGFQEPDTGKWIAWSSELLHFFFYQLKYIILAFELCWSG